MVLRGIVERTLGPLGETRMSGRWIVGVPGRVLLLADDRGVGVGNVDGVVAGKVLPMVVVVVLLVAAALEIVLVVCGRSRQSQVVVALVVHLVWRIIRQEG